MSGHVLAVLPYKQSCCERQLLRGIGGVERGSKSCAYGVGQLTGSVMWSEW
jgi:hypothetical protein